MDCLPEFSTLDREYPAWCQDNEVPVTKQDLRYIFEDLTHKFGFQHSSKENMYHHMLTQLDSRSSRTTAYGALISLHASYIGGDVSNFKKWYFAAQLDLDEELGYANMQLRGQSYKRNIKLARQKGLSIKKQQEEWRQKQIEFIANHPHVNLKSKQKEDNYYYKAEDYKWKSKMRDLTPIQMARQIALYLLIWGESNQLRFTPECLCFIFKCALDYDIKISDNSDIGKPEFSYLNEIVTPLYCFLKDQVYTKTSKGNLVRQECDYKDIIGYDDVNQLFWYPEGIERIVLDTGERLIDKPLEERYKYLKNVIWDKVFYKTYKETRTWMHCMTNFNRFWIIHFSTFWFFTSFNSPTLYTKNYNQLLNNQPTLQSRFSAVALGGSITCLLQILATIFEWTFVPREWPGAQHLSKRMIGLICCFALNFGPAIYIFGFFDLDEQSKSGLIISIIQFVIAIITTVFFSIRPLGGLFVSYLNKDTKRRRYSSSQTFTASFPTLRDRSKWISRGLWMCVFTAKFLESYFFLTLSLRDPIRLLSILNMTRCRGDKLIGRILCKWQPSITLLLMVLTDLILFFLDTYLWYIICNCIFSILLSLSLGTSIFTPWKNIYSRLPKRIYTKILATSEMDIKYKPKILISQVWNALIISMYREHLLSIDHVQKLLFQQVDSPYTDKKTLRTPSFFQSQDDSTLNSVQLFPRNSEAQRRLSFFAQSLSTHIHDPIPIECMPTFTVLIPHYSEKILLSLKEIIKEESNKSRISLLEYLKNLHPSEWEYFVHDTKLLAIENGDLNSNLSSFKTYSDDEKDIKPSNTYSNSNFDIMQEKINDLPYYSVGFSGSNSEYTLRTRIWASLRTQTLYRTISGFMNYSRALKLLYRIENPSLIRHYGDKYELLENELNKMARRKFKMVVAMQRYSKFNNEEMEATEFIMKIYPEIMISFLQEERDIANPDGDLIYYSCLIDGTCPIDPETNRRIPKFKIRLSGNPILGDGKSDNQNHSIIFYRGEYIQVIDSNQDNYLEECLKIRSILCEFEEIEMDNFMPYIPGIEYQEQPSPIAIIGAREYIFSENIGILGDIAAGKEQTFGTLFARTLAEIGAKLHYGHPDFLNAIFMTTRGGISKAQRGLHLNEDIYAGITAICRGGRIKHTDYFQCGKGRDLGFGSILGFITKIGAGMGEQLLSREYYYLGTQLPIDRFLSFFYAHPGFHLNNLFITLSVQLFFILLLNLGALKYETILCAYNKDTPINELDMPIGCYNLEPVLHWVSVFVLSIFIVFFIAFAPLLIQELLEKGIYKAIARFLSHIISMAPLFEVFVCQVYSISLIQNMIFGNAQYIFTGRSFAITRLDFDFLYMMYANTSIYSGAKIFLMLLFATCSMWQPSLLWFWITVISMCLAPFIFNPHQFSFTSFFVDYKNFITWLSIGNSQYCRNSWAFYVKQRRSKFTGFKKKLIGDISENGAYEFKRMTIKNVYASEILMPLCTVIFCVTAYTFINAQTGVKFVQPTQSLARLLVITFFPIILNSIIIFLLFLLSLFFGPLLSFYFINTSDVIAGIAHGASVIVYLISFELMWFLESWNFTRTLALLITFINFQEFIFKILTLLLLTREYRNDKLNTAWWSGNWYNTSIGWPVIFQPLREYLVKLIESSYYAGDFILGHLLLYVQIPILLIPYIDYWHSMILFWFHPRNLTSSKLLFTRKEKIKRRHTVRKYVILYLLILVMFISLLMAPLVLQGSIPNGVDLFKSTVMEGIVQPNNQNNNDTGPSILKALSLTSLQIPSQNH